MSETRGTAIWVYTVSEQGALILYDRNSSGNKAAQATGISRPTTSLLNFSISGQTILVSGLI
jgi:hypothetical protein